MKSAALGISVSAESPLRVSADANGKRVVDAIRRRLRKQGVELLLERTQRSMGSLIRLEGGAYLVPTTLLSQVTALARKYGIDAQVVDERRDVPCSRLVSSPPPLTDVQAGAVRRMLRRDCGVLISPETDDLLAVAVALVTRHRQRTLWLVGGEERRNAVRHYVGEIGEDAESADDQLVCLRYEEVGVESVRGYGMLILDDFAQADAATLLTLVTSYTGHWLFGLADRATRVDGLQDIFIYLFGGVLHDLPSARSGTVVRLVFRARITNFASPYQGRSDYQALLAALISASSRNATIAEDLMAEVAQGRCAVVISDRREHLKTLTAELSGGVLERSALVSSDRSPSERAEILSAFGAGQIDVLLCTSQVANDALRARPVDCLFLVFPFSYATKILNLLTELCGRTANDKVIVYDYDDILVDPLHRAFEKRAQMIRRVQSTAEREFANWSQLGLPLAELGG